MKLAESLAKETLLILFRSFPGEFVLVGGGALHWIFHSPRLSLDIDIKPLQAPTKDFLIDLASVLERELDSWAAEYQTTVACQVEESNQAIRILLGGRTTLHVELAALAPVTGKEKHLLQSDSLRSEIIITPNIHELLLSKAAALAKRAHVKGRDVFDIWFLQSRGAVLDEPAFRDWLQWEEIDGDDLAAKLKELTPSRLKADLAPFLPDSIHASLAQEHYKSLIDAAQHLFKPFL